MDVDTFCLTVKIFNNKSQWYNTLYPLTKYRHSNNIYLHGPREEIINYIGY